MADEVLAVEAVPLEEDFDTLVASLAIDDTLEDKLAKLKKNVDEKLADYVDVKHIEKDEDFKAAKKYRAAVNDVKKPIEAQRKAAKKKYSDPLKTFDKTISEITAPIDKLSDEYKAEIDRYDGECRKRRLTALKGHYYDLAGEMGPLVPYERIADDRWLNASFGEVKAKNIIERRVGELLHQFKFVNGLDYADESEKAWAVAWWTRTLPADSGEVAAAVPRTARRRPRPPRSYRPTSRRRHRSPSRSPRRCRPTPSRCPSRNLSRPWACRGVCGWSRRAPSRMRPRMRPQHRRGATALSSSAPRQTSCVA